MGYNKQFLYATVGAPCNDAKIIKSTHIYREILNGKVISDRKLHLESGDEISLITVGDSVFLRHPRLLKVYNEETQDPQQRHLKKKLYSARVVTENAYGMLKGRWHILYKKTDCRIFNLKYIVMTSIMLHNLWISIKDPCEPRWHLEVQELSLIKEDTTRKEDKHISDLTRLKISKWEWNLKP